MKPICIYHSNCADGYTAAWVAHHAFNGEIDLYPGVHQQSPPDVTDREVYLVDFSYKRPVLEKMRDQAKRIVILDHHKTAEADLKDLPGIETVFDMDRCGAKIAWDYWNPNKSPPKTLLHVEDRDLWRFAIPYTREISSAIFSYPYQIENWDMLMNSDPLVLVEEGKTLERKQQKDINELLPILTRKMNIAGHVVSIANLPYTLCDAANTLAIGSPFAGSYYDTPHGRVFSLRSKDSGLDVSEIAKMYGGGGHKNAAGFRVSYEVAKTFEL